MKINDVIHGFRLVNIRDVSDISSTLYEFEHERTGARLAWMKNSEENKLFSIAFKTLPSDDTGVFHILEHSVLGGSEKYPLKEPFLELLKGSLNTFLNAMTFPDMTVYPVSSRNEKDFMNLTRVYLDAVFRPAIHTYRRIFEQEGWHLEWRGDGEGPTYKGVVFNEMKGAFSSLKGRVMTEMCRMLFPDNCYRFESGGDPVFIPDLTYETFTALHKKYYAPANAYIFLDGDLDVEPVMRLINDEYLSDRESGEAAGDIVPQTSISPTTRRLEYEISADQPTEGQTDISYGKVLGFWFDKEKMFAVSAISEALAGSNEAPLKRALLDTGHCLDVSLGLCDGVMQPFGMLEIMNTDEEYAAELSNCAADCVAQILASGIDREALSSAIDRMEFRYREGSEPKGLDRNINALYAWIHGGDLLTYIDCSDVFASLRERLDSDFYEKILREWLADEEGRATLVMVPSREYGDELRAREKSAEAELAELDEQGKAELVRENELLEEWQESVDSPEALATLPSLALSEVSEIPLKLETVVGEQNGVEVLFHPAKERGIVSINLYFSAADLSVDEIFDLRIISGLLGELPTKNKSALELRRRITSVFGDLTFSVDAFAGDDDRERCRPFFAAHASFLETKREQAFELLSEILTETLFVSELINEQLLQEKENFKHSITARGTTYAYRRVLASFSAENAFAEITSGYESYSRLGGLIADFAKAPESCIARFIDLLSRLVCRARLTLSVTAASKIDTASLLSALPDGESAAKSCASYSVSVPAFEGIVVPAQVCYSAIAFEKRAADIPAWKVLTSILSLEYLWNEIRVKGGAYGAGAAVTHLGALAFNSFRDPSAENSRRAYEGAADFVRAFFSDPPSLDRYIIGAVAKQEPLLSDAARGSLADTMYFRGTSEEARAAERRRILSLTPKDFLCDLDVLLSGSTYCVIGSENTVKAFENEGIIINGI